MSKVMIVTDSTAYIPDDILFGLPIRIVPLQVIWGQEQFRDGIDIQPNEFYERLKTANEMPSTSQTTPSTFKTLYEELSEQGYEIFSIHISQKLSGTIDSAFQAKDLLKLKNIEIFDSEAAGMALGFQVLAVARAANNGATLKDCLKIAEKARDQTGILFAVKTLEFLHRGGRIGSAANLVGTMLNLKPILELQNGKIESVDKVRTMNKALDKVVDMLVSKVQDHQPIRISIQHANAYTEAEQLLERVKLKFPNGKLAETMISEVSPAIGTHTGPGLLGIAYMYGM
ncbi:MAG: DegV family protein [Anaerolineaceae bacterium]